MADTDRAWVLPDEPRPVRLMNTIWADRGQICDDLKDTGDLAAWLEQVGLTAVVPPTTVELKKARDLRDALRRIAAFATEDRRVLAESAMPDITQAVDVINERLGTGAPAEHLVIKAGTLGRKQSDTRSPVAASLAVVSTEAVELFTAPDAPILRACMAPGCVLYFVQTHPRREWCSVACGNRARATRHYHRHRENAVLSTT
ncbi:ABATE domain-containing protein [Arthrobacter sp. R1-13]